MEQKREYININTSDDAERLDVSGADGMIAIAVVVNVLFLLALFILG